ncbi:hypothetical protein [Endozoicomonas euniceicola]|uniref:Uncharacterized protein n=1 Tax=Endozoicomonas euniceicola TaxID=1234143 RepID=A0ABY6GMN1_9GAMM|nr:hypothetical protein [Endozoicomonas euniceicola]UYM13987.1 hypothetical protein NX720_13805 [Endozoicomonas euniceicola]
MNQKIPLHRVDYLTLNDEKVIELLTQSLTHWPSTIGGKQTMSELVLENNYQPTSSVTEIPAVDRENVLAEPLHKPSEKADENQPSSCAPAASLDHLLSTDSTSCPLTGTFLLICYLIVNRIVFFWQY